MRVFSLKIKEDDYTRRMLGALNAELSPFKDEESKDAPMMREMLDHYRKMENFDAATTDRQIERADTTVHAYLKKMESGKFHRDTKTLEKLQRGVIEKDNARVKEYLTRRLQEIPKAM